MIKVKEDGAVNREKQEARLETKRQVDPLEIHSGSRKRIFKVGGMQVRRTLQKIILSFCK